MNNPENGDDNSMTMGQGLPDHQAMCGMCAFYVEFQVKGGPAAIGQSQARSECRRLPPSTLAILGLPLDAISAALKGPSIIGGGVQARSAPQMAVLQPISGAPAYPPVPPNFPACGEFQPSAAMLAEAQKFMAEQETKNGVDQNNS